jgi:hypothetical protein
LKNFEEWADKAQAQVASGNNPNLYRWLYVQIDSVIDKDSLGEFDITDLQIAGLDGWDIVGVLPKTFGERLTNLSTHGNTWGAASGGHVLGVYLILSKEVKDLNDPLTRGDANRIVTSLIGKGIEL